MAINTDRVIISVQESRLLLGSLVSSDLGPRKIKTDMLFFSKTIFPSTSRFFLKRKYFQGLTVISWHHILLFTSSQ